MDAEPIDVESLTRTRQRIWIAACIVMGIAASSLFFLNRQSAGLERYWIRRHLIIVATAYNLGEPRGELKPMLVTGVSRAYRQRFARGIAVYLDGRFHIYALDPLIPDRRQMQASAAVRRRSAPGPPRGLSFM